MKILIVDDDAVFVNGMKKLLELRTIPAVMATNVTGLEVLQYATEKNIPVVFFTGHDEDSYKEKAMSLAVARYYIKGQTNCRNIINELITLLARQHLATPQIATK